jgi:halocyanin-like protein
MVILGENGPPEEVPSTPRFDVAYDEASSGTLIGQGGNADVYKITVERPDQAIPLAIKQPRIQQTLTKDIVERFTEETRVWKSLDSHDYIVNIVDADDTPVPWIAMEYMDGGTLGSLISEEQLPFSQAVWVGLCVTRAVRHAHRHGVAHHDIKPANVLFRRSETGWMVPKVSDWGLARMMLEETNSVAGLSPQYAAPEQFDADTFGSPDDQTDIYQLGVLLYELFTGKPPFDGAAAAVMQNILTEQPDPPSSIAQVPAAVDNLIMPALQKSKSDRYDSTVYIRDGLENLFSSTSEMISTSGSTVDNQQSEYALSVNPAHKGANRQIEHEPEEIAGQDGTDVTKSNAGADTKNTESKASSENNHSSRRRLLKYAGIGGIVTSGAGLGVWGATTELDTSFVSNDEPASQGGDDTGTASNSDSSSPPAESSDDPSEGVSSNTESTTETTSTSRIIEDVPNKIDGYLDSGEARMYEGTMIDHTGQDEISIRVGAGDIGFAFDPPAVRINAGTTVAWEWTGEGGAHNIVSEDASATQFNSGDPINETGYTFEQTFEQPGIQLYYCTPHKANGKIGGIEVV